MLRWLMAVMGDHDQSLEEYWVHHSLLLLLFSSGLAPHLPQLLLDLDHRVQAPELRMR